MKQLIAYYLLISSLASFGQAPDEEKRIIKGLIWDPVSHSTAIGSNVLQYKTINGAVVRADGTFELAVPKNDTVLIHIPFCFESYFIRYLPTDSYKKIILNKRLRKQSEKTLANWKEK